MFGTFQSVLPFAAGRHVPCNTASSPVGNNQPYSNPERGFTVRINPPLCIALYSFTLVTELGQILHEIVSQLEICFERLSSNES